MLLYLIGYSRSRVTIYNRNKLFGTVHPQWATDTMNDKEIRNEHYHRRGKSFGRSNNTELMAALGEGPHLCRVTVDEYGVLVVERDWNINKFGNWEVFSHTSHDEPVICLGTKRRVKVGDKFYPLYSQYVESDIEMTSGDIRRKKKQVLRAGPITLHPGTKNFCVQLPYGAPSNRYLVDQSSLPSQFLSLYPLHQRHERKRMSDDRAEIEKDKHKKKVNVRSAYLSY